MPLKYADQVSEVLIQINVLTVRVRREPALAVQAGLCTVAQTDGTLRDGRAWTVTRCSASIRESAARRDARSAAPLHPRG